MFAKNVSQTKQMKVSVIDMMTKYKHCLIIAVLNEEFLKSMALMF